MPEEPLQPVPMGEVFLADDERRRRRAAHGRLSRARARAPASRSASIAPAAPTRRSTSTPIFSSGPRRRTSTSPACPGLATKTSAVEWMLSSIFTHFPAQKGSVAAVCFNVKGPDLCFLDQPGDDRRARPRAVREVRRARRRRSRTCSTSRRTSRDGVSLNTLRSNEALLHNVTPLTWGLREVLQYAEVLLNKDDVDAKADALIDFIRERVVDRDVHAIRCCSAASAIACGRSPISRQWFRDLLVGDGAAKATRAGARITSRRFARCATASRTSRRDAPVSSPTTAP